MSGSSFETMDVTTARRALSRLHELIIKTKGRIELTRRGCDDVCILISKAELDSLEQALEIYAQTDTGKDMCARLSDLAASVRPTPSLVTTVD
jgi:hypothetical protein